MLLQVALLTIKIITMVTFKWFILMKFNKRGIIRSGERRIEAMVEKGLSRRPCIGVIENRLSERLACWTNSRTSFVRRERLWV